MNAYRIRRLGEMWHLLAPADASCIGVCEELGLILQTARVLAARNHCEIHLFGDAERLDAVFMNLSCADSSFAPRDELATGLEDRMAESHPSGGLAYG